MWESQFQKNLAKNWILFSEFLSLCCACVRQRQKIGASNPLKYLLPNDKFYIIIINKNN